MERENLLELMLGERPRLDERVEILNTTEQSA